jgi:hypothetical protein
MLLGEIKEVKHKTGICLGYHCTYVQSPPLPRESTHEMLYFHEILASVFGIQDFETVKWDFFIYYNEIIKIGANTICSP